MIEDLQAEVGHADLVEIRKHEGETDFRSNLARFGGVELSTHIPARFPDQRQNVIEPDSV
ncbi:MAG: hypothetical protein Kow0089_21890 [Desulfobulbaceae bacterium]